MLAPLCLASIGGAQSRDQAVQWTMLGCLQAEHTDRRKDGVWTAQGLCWPTEQREAIDGKEITQTRV